MCGLDQEERVRILAQIEEGQHRVVVGTATDAAKEIADIILLDNNLSTI